MLETRGEGRVPATEWATPNGKNREENKRAEFFIFFPIMFFWVLLLGRHTCKSKKTHPSPMFTYQQKGKITVGHRVVKDKNAHYQPKIQEKIGIILFHPLFGLYPSVLGHAAPWVFVFGIVGGLLAGGSKRIDGGGGGP